jgi:hypothetical protein
MSNQPSSQATNVNPPAERQSNARNEEAWSALRCTDPGEPDVAGYLQLCADRRFHRCIQDQFEADAGLNSSEEYWIHADAGGTPKMECQRTAPDYCYYDKGVEWMGWSAHGNVCGGFGPNVPDDVIQRALDVVARRKVEEYPNATHLVYFVTLRKEGDAEEAVVYCMKYEKSAA